MEQAAWDSFVLDWSSQCRCMCVCVLDCVGSAKDLHESWCYRLLYSHLDIISKHFIQQITVINVKSSNLSQTSSLFMRWEDIPNEFGNYFTLSDNLRQLLPHFVYVSSCILCINHSLMVQVAIRHQIAQAGCMDIQRSQRILQEALQNTDEPRPFRGLNLHSSSER